MKLHFCWLIDSWNPSREKYLRAWQDRGFQCVLWHSGQLQSVPVAGVELQEAQDVVIGSSIEEVYKYEHQHRSHASCADLLRFELLRVFGGAYVDIDVYPGQAAVPTLDATSLLFGRQDRYPKNLEMRFVAAPAHHELLGLILAQSVTNEKIFIRRRGYQRGIQCIMKRTGPLMLAPVVEEYARRVGRTLDSFILDNATLDDTPENNEHYPQRFSQILEAAAKNKRWLSSWVGSF